MDCNLSLGCLQILLTKQDFTGGLPLFIPQAIGEDSGEALSQRRVLEDTEHHILQDTESYIKGH